MKIKFLGTAAAEGWPAIFCNCEACNKARINKGKDIRTRFSLMIDEKYKVDFPPDSYHHMLKYDLDYTKLEYLFITHPHSDHLLPIEFEFRGRWYCNLRDDHRLNIYGWEETIKKIKQEVAEGNEPILHEVKEFDCIETEDFKVYVLPANHMHVGVDHPYIYLFNRKVDNKNFLCAHDTGYFFPEVWEFLKKFKIEIVSLDCTHGGGSSLNNHLGHKETILVKEKMEELKIFNNGVFIVNHFSHNGKWSHEEMCNYFQRYGILVAYDGMEIQY